MKSIQQLLFITALVSLLGSCKKEDKLGFLGGDTNIPLTQVGSETSLYPSIGTIEFPSTTAVITANNNGLVTYKLSLDLDLRGNPDSAFIANVVQYVKDEGIITVDADGLIDLGFQMFITSEGYQVMSEDGRPQTIVRYDDPVGTKYYFDNIFTSSPVVGTVTEKTGEDDWPLGFLYIKTSKVEFVYPNEVPFLEKLTIRANHKFGIVYLEIKFRGVGTPGKVDFYPWFLL